MEQTVFDVSGFIGMLRRLFSASGVHLRELVQNSLEAINQAARHGTHGGEVRIDSDRDDGFLTISDDGIGMSEEALLTQLVVLFRSGWPTEAGATLGIGQFGFGFYSVFLVADEVQVVSRPRIGPDQAHRLILTSEMRAPQLAPVSTNVPFGTSVTLKLKSDSRQFADEALIRNELRKIYLYSPSPLVVNGRPLGLPTPQSWRRPFTDRGAAVALGEWLQERYSWSNPPLYIAPLHIDNGGWLAVAPRHEHVPSLEVYRRGVAVTRKELIPRPFNFMLCGVVDMHDISLKPDRETLLEDEDYERLIRKLESASREALITSSQRPGRVQEMFQAHRGALTRAMNQDSSLRGKLGPYYPVRPYNRSSWDTEDTQTLRELIERRERVIWVGEPGIERSLADRAYHLGQSPILTVDTDEQDLITEICSDMHVKCLRVSDAFVEDMRSAGVESPRIIKLFRSVLDPNSEILCCEDEDVRSPLRIVKLSSGFRSAFSFRMRRGEEPKPTLVAVINRKSQIIQRLEEAADPPLPIEERIVNLLIYLAKTSGGLPLSSGEIDRFNDELLSLLTQSQATAMVMMTPSRKRTCRWNWYWKRIWALMARTRIAEEKDE